MHAHFQLSGKELCAAMFFALPISQLFYIIYNTFSLGVLLWGAFLSGSCRQAEKCCSVFQALVFHSHSPSCRQPALESASSLAGSGSWLCFSGYTNQWTWRCLAGALMEPTLSMESHWDAFSADLRTAPCTSPDMVCCFLCVPPAEPARLQLLQGNSDTFSHQISCCRGLSEPCCAAQPCAQKSSVRFIYLTYFEIII